MAKSDMAVYPESVLVFSSRLKNITSFEIAKKQNIRSTVYSHNSNVEEIIQRMRKAFGSSRFDTIGILTTCRPSGVNILHGENGFISGNGVLSDAKDALLLFDKLIDGFLNDGGIIHVLGVKAVDNISFLRAQFHKMYRGKIILASDVTGTDVLVAQTHRKADANFEKLTLNDYYFKSKKTDGRKVLNGYDKIKVVGRGAQGTATLYKNKSSGGLVIIKEISTQELSPTERQFAVNEANVLKIMDHPNIIRYECNFEIEGNLHLMMEYADGGSLSQYVSKHAKNGPLEESEVVRIFSQIVSGLTYMHDKRILHRDLKSQNIFMTCTGFVKIGDLGIAKVMTTNNQTVVGTCSYIAPELCEARGYDGKSDIWSLGCVLYEMCARKKCFDGDNPLAIVKKIIAVDYEHLSKKEYSSRLRNLVSKMLQKDPKKRPSSYDLEHNLVPELQNQINQSTSPIEQDTEISSDVRSNIYNYSTDNLSMILQPGISHQTKIRQIATGDSHILVLTQDHQVFTFGSNDVGQIGRNIIAETSQSEPILNSIKSVTAGADFSIFLGDNGVVTSCGSGKDGCLGHNDEENILRPKLIQNLLHLQVEQISAGYKHVLALTTDGEVYSWGVGLFGCLGHGDELNSSVPRKIKIDEKVIQIYAGYDSSFFICESGNIYVCGCNRHNKLGLWSKKTILDIFTNKPNQIEMKSVPTQIKLFSASQRVRQVSQARDHTIFLTYTGMIYSLGRNDEGQRGLGHMRPVNELTPMQIPTNNSDNAPIKSIIRIATSNFMSMAVAQVQGDQQVVLFCGTRYVSPNRDIDDAEKKSSFGSVRLNLQSVESAEGNFNWTHSFSSSIADNLSLTEADHHGPENELRPPLDKKAFNQPYLEGTIFLDEESTKVNQISLIQSTQNFLFTIDYVPSSQRQSSSDSLGDQRHTMNVNNDNFNNATESDDSDDIPRTWLRNELAQADDFGPNNNNDKPKDLEVPKVLQIKHGYQREGTMGHKLLVIPAGLEEKKKPKRPIRKRTPVMHPVKSSVTPSKSASTRAPRPKTGPSTRPGFERPISGKKMNELLSSMQEEKDLAEVRAQAAEKVIEEEKQEKLRLERKYEQDKIELEKDKQHLQQQLDMMKSQMQRQTLNERDLEEKYADFAKMQRKSMAVNDTRSKICSIM